MPANQRVSLDDRQQLTPVDQPRQRHQRDASRVVGAAWPHLPREIQRQLLSQEQVLSRQLGARVQRQESEACNIGEHADDRAEGDGKTESAHGLRAYAISVAISSARGHSWESFAPHQRKSPPDGVFANDNVDTTIIRLLDGSRAYVHAVIDNFSRRILAWRVAETFAPVNSVAVLAEAGRGAMPGTTPMVLADAGVENVNA